MGKYNYSIVFFLVCCYHYRHTSFSQEVGTHIVLGEVDEILQVDVISVRLDIVVDEKVELVFDPVLKDEGEDARSQLQEEDQTQEHRKLESVGQAKEETHKK